MKFIEIRVAWFNSTCEPGPVPSIMKTISSADMSPAMTPTCSFRRAWLLAVLKAHGIKSAYAKGVKPAGRKKGGWKELTAECLEEFRRINLRWHDLRHEYASRLVERGVPLAQVRDLLGHASITTTERYDNQTLEALQAAAARLETGKQFDPAAVPDAGPKFQDSFKNPTPEPCTDALEAEDESRVTACEIEGFEGWLAVRDDFRTWVIANAA